MVTTASFVTLLLAMCSSRFLTTSFPQPRNVVIVSWLAARSKWSAGQRHQIKLVTYCVRLSKMPAIHQLFTLNIAIAVYGWNTG
jgi:hypothetical protein